LCSGSRWGSHTFDLMGFPEGSGVEFRVLSYSSQSKYRMNKQQQQQQRDTAQKQHT